MEIDDDFISAGTALIKVSDKKNCDSLESLIKNWEVVEWIKTNFKGFNLSFSVVYNESFKSKVCSHSRCPQN